MAKAAAVQYAQVRPIEHVHPLVRTQRQLDRVMQEIAVGARHRPLHRRQRRPDERARAALPRAQRALPARPRADHEGVRKSYLGAPQTPIVAGQHVLDADYFRRIDALNFAMVARRRPPAGRPQRGRHHHPRHLAHVEDADLHLSGPARLQDRQRAAGARHRSARCADRAAQGLRRRPHRAAPSGSSRSAATACA